MASHTSSPEARSRAVTKFVKEKIDRIEIRTPKKTGFKQAVTEHAAKQGESVNAFIIRAIKEAMENDSKKSQS